MSLAARFRPLVDRLLVKRLDAVKTTPGGLLIPEKNASKTSEAEVIAVGPGIRDNKGELIPMSVKKGETVLLPDYGFTTVKFDNIEYLIVREGELLGRIEKA